MDAGELLDLLGNENRRRILRLLSRKPCYVTEISEYLGVSPKAVIDHLRRLEEAGLIESRTDEQRRKYFHIAQNLRLEVTVSPYGFGMKSAYPASPTLDLSSCQHISLDVRTHERHGSRATAEAGTHTGDRGNKSTNKTTNTPAEESADIGRLASELDELEELERELSLAQRWAQGRIADVLDRLVNSIDDNEDYLDAEVLAAVAGGASTVADVSQETDAPPTLIEERLTQLERRGLLRQIDGRWRLA